MSRGEERREVLYIYCEFLEMFSYICAIVFKVSSLGFKSNMRNVIDMDKLLIEFQFGSSSVVVQPEGLKCYPSQCGCETDDADKNKIQPLSQTSMKVTFLPTKPKL